MQGIGVAERLGLGPEVRELKLGSSITSNTSKFHTLKCKYNNFELRFHTFYFAKVRNRNEE